MPSTCSTSTVRPGERRDTPVSGGPAGRRAPPGPPGSALAGSPRRRRARPRTGRSGGPARRPRASTSIPESSASAGSSRAAATATRLQPSVLQVGLAGLLDVGERRPGRGSRRSPRMTGQSAQIRASSRSLWGLRVAERDPVRHAVTGPPAPPLDLRQLGDPRRGEVEQRVELRARTVRPPPSPAPRRAAVPGHHDVAVDLRAGVLLVAEVQARLAVDEARRSPPRPSHGALPRRPGPRSASASAT